MFGTKHFSAVRRTLCGFEAIQTVRSGYISPNTVCLKIRHLWWVSTCTTNHQIWGIPLSVSWLPLRSVAVWVKHWEQRCSASSSALPRADTYTWSAESLSRLLWLAEVSVGWVCRHPIHLHMFPWMSASLPCTQGNCPTFLCGERNVTLSEDISRLPARNPELRISLLCVFKSSPDA